MSERFEPRVARLRRALLEGLGKASSAEVRQELRLETDAPDLEAARSLVQIVSACSVAVALVFVRCPMSSATGPWST